MDIVAMEIGMSLRCGVEIDCRNVAGSYYLPSNRIAGRNSGIGVFRLGVVSNIFAVAQRSCGCPNQLRFRRMCVYGYAVSEVLVVLVASVLRRDYADARSKFCLAKFSSFQVTL